MTHTNPDTLSRGSYSNSRRVADILRAESVGGTVLLIATVLAVVLANTPASSFYFGLRDTVVGPVIPGFNHLQMSIGTWAADGLLVVFFFLTGLELKKEFVIGDLKSPPTATDIAFAVSVLAAVGTFLPSAMRVFLLTLAVVDDLIAICIIAIFYTNNFHGEYLLFALIPLALFAFIAYRGETMLHLKPLAAWILLLPLGIITWALFLESGIHATISGVVLGFLVPVKMSARSEAAQAEHGLAEVLEHRFRPLSTGICVPIFAFFSAGVAVGGFEGLGRALTDSVAVGIMVALVAGKTIGIFGTTWLVTRFKNANLDPDVAWIDVIGLAATGGIGFTVSLLVAELSFPHGSPHTEDAKIAILVGSVLAAIVGAIILSRRNKHYRALAEKESVDADDNGIPDVFEGTYRDPKTEA